ncbi:glycosyltransferase [Pedobacter agri]|uniref:Glycosyltransferase n=1 Tax=Pedobacter agri TaxID=454586 RepID=A0A9X3DAP5_9SPHI|nr:glycosyltransferase [Pedobacter agri]MCX3264047.1 glycosyltransferase [Pedobacter agri]
MRILIVHTYYKQQGGEDAVVQNEMALLQSDGHEVELIDFSNASATLLKVLLMPFNPYSYFTMLKKIKSFKPDIVHVHNLHYAATPSVLYAAKKMQVPIVMTIHNYRLLCPSGSLFFKNKLFLKSLDESFPWSAVREGVYQQSKVITFWLAISNYLHRKIGTWRLVNAMIFLGEHSGKIFEQSGLIHASTKTFLKPNFTNQKKSAAVNSAGEYYLFIGRLSEEKGIKTLLKAFEHRPEMLKIAGTGPLRDFVSEAGTHFVNVEYLDHLSKTEIEEMIVGSKALIFPSEWYETFGMVMIEAFSLAKPVIAADLGNIPSIVKDQVNGLTFSPGNVLELQRKLYEFENMDSQAKQNLAAGALFSYHQYYAPEVNLKQLIHIYSDTLASKNT